MKNNPTLIGLALAILIVLFSVAFYFVFLNKKDFYLIDNPSDEIIELKINDVSYKLAPHQNVEVNLEKGEYRLIVLYNGKETDTTFHVNSTRGLINPTKTDYYIFERPYGHRENIDSLYTSHETLIDDKIYLGRIDIKNDFYIEDFYYNLTQSYPKFFMKKYKDSDLKKIFTKQEFKQFYFRHYE